jgi:hypothetical protein
MLEFNWMVSNIFFKKECLMRVILMRYCRPGKNANYTTNFARCNSSLARYDRSEDGVGGGERERLSAAYPLGANRASGAPDVFMKREIV